MSSPKKNKPRHVQDDQPYPLHHRFLNVASPLQFIKQQDMPGIFSQYRKLKDSEKESRDRVSQFSKNIYKKVISRDNQYHFTHQIYGNQEEQVNKFNQKAISKGKVEKAQHKVQKQDLQRKFKHGEVISMQEKRERLREEKQIPLTFAHIKMLDTPEFDHLQNVQFYHLLKGDADDVIEDQHTSSFKLQNDVVKTYLKSFSHQIIEQSQYYTKRSYQFLLQTNKQLAFWKKRRLIDKTDDQILSACAFLNLDSISIFSMFDFASKNLEIDDMVRFRKLTSNLFRKMSLDKDNESLEQKFNEAKRKFEEMRENRLKAKNQRIPIKFVSTKAQTNDEMQEKDFEEYFVQDAKNIFNRLRKLNDIRDRIVKTEHGETFRVMATNIGVEISKQLFKLLLMVLKGERLNYSQLMEASKQEEVERKILELIYMQFTNFKQHEVDGVSKTDIVKTYLQEREKNQRFYETYLYQQIGPVSQKPVKQSSKTPTKRTKK